MFSRNAPPHWWGGALGDDAKNGCVADYASSWFMFLRREGRRRESIEERAPSILLSLPSSGWCFWLVVPRGKSASTNQKHYPDLGSHTSSVWNFCARSSDVISLFPHAKLPRFQHVSRNAQTTRNNDPQELHKAFSCLSTSLMLFKVNRRTCWAFHGLYEFFFHFATSV